MSVGHLDHVLIVYNLIEHMWPGNHLVPCVAESVGSCIPIHARRCLPDPKCQSASPQLTVLTEHYGTLWFIRRTRSKMKSRSIWSTVSLARTAPDHMLERQAGVWSEDQGAQERSGLFHSWYTGPSLQGKGEQCNSQVSHHRPCRGREPYHRLRQGKSGRQRGTATDQMGKWVTLD